MIEVFFILFFVVMLVIFGRAAIIDFFRWLRRK